MSEIRKKVSFVIPCYHSEKTLAGVVAEIDAAMAQLPQYGHEIVMVNDGSGEATWEVIRALCAETVRKDPVSDPAPRDDPPAETVQSEAASDAVPCKEGCREAMREEAKDAEVEPTRPVRKGYDLSRNFGQHAALMAGIRHTDGDIVVCLDDDGQTPAEEVGSLLSAIEGGADVVYASYEHKEHSAFRNFGSRVNEKMLEWMLDKPKDLFVSSYFAMRRYVADEVLCYENSYPYLLGLVLRTTSNIVNVPVQHRRREVGHSGYTLGKLVNLWLNGFTAFSVKPLRLGTGVGVVCAVLAAVYGVYTIIKKFINPNVPTGWSALMTAVVFFGGMILIMLGLVGEYIGRTYISVNNAPQYVIREETGPERSAEAASPQQILRKDPAKEQGAADSAACRRSAVKMPGGAPDGDILC